MIVEATRKVKVMLTVSFEKVKVILTVSFEKVKNSPIVQNQSLLTKIRPAKLVAVL